MTQARSLFEHHHPGGQGPHDHDHHGHDHHHDQGPQDPAQQSLADALRVCFLLLKFVMLTLLAIYCVSGLFNVRQQEKAVRLLFGRIVGGEGRQVLDPGGPYLAAPFPIMQVVRIPTSPRDLSIDRAFWYEVDPNNPAAPPQARALSPERDGSLLTGDANIVHVRWTLTYAVKDPIKFVTHVGDQATAEQLVLAATEQAVVRAVGQITADQASKGVVNADVARGLAQATLDAMLTGLELLTLTPAKPVFPVSVQSAFDAVTNADATRGRLITQAQETRNRVLQEAAGGAWPALWQRVQAHELALQGSDPAAVDATGKALDAALDTLQVADARSGEVRQIGGEVSRLLYDARSYRSNVVQEITAEASTFNRLREQWRSNRGVIEAAYLREARLKVLSNARETFWTPAGQLYLELNRDPKIAQEQEKARLASPQTRQQSPAAGGN